MYLNKQEGSPVRNISPKHLPNLETLQEDVESLAAEDVEEEEAAEEEQTKDTQHQEAKSDNASTITSSAPRSFISRVLRAALPIQLLILFYIVAVIILPSVVINGDGECAVSMTDRLMFNGHRWIPTVRYTRGPPPM